MSRPGVGGSLSRTRGEGDRVSRHVTTWGRVAICLRSCAPSVTGHISFSSLCCRRYPIRIRDVAVSIRDAFMGNVKARFLLATTKMERMLIAAILAQKAATGGGAPTPSRV